MEDILASIRRILDEDPAAADKPAAEGGELVLDETMLAADSPPAPAPPPEPVAIAPPPPPELAPAPAAGGLLNPAAADTASSAMAGLARAVAAERGAGLYRGGPTIEDVVREEMRPLLKEWLDAYLPPLVERLVRAEIERVSRSAL
jgi:cell pole-organizing protein PopZ